MSEVLALDCSGKPIRVGDAIVFVDCFLKSEGNPVGRSGRAIGRWRYGVDTDIQDPTQPGETFWGPGKHFMLIDGGEDESVTADAEQESEVSA